MNGDIEMGPAQQVHQLEVTRNGGSPRSSSILGGLSACRVRPCPGAGTAPLPALRPQQASEVDPEHVVAVQLSVNSGPDGDAQADLDKAPNG